MAEAKKQTKVNTTKSLNQASLSQYHKDMIEKANNKFKQEKKREVSVPERLRKHVGNELFLSVNGVKVVLPVGEKVKLAETLAKHLEDYKDNVRT